MHSFDRPRHEVRVQRSVLVVEYLFTIQGTAQTTAPILTLDGSNDVFCRKEVPFGGHNRQKSPFGGILPPKPPNFLL